MKHTRRPAHIPMILLIGLLLAACNFPGGKGDSSPGVTPSLPANSSDAEPEMTEEAPPDDGQSDGGDAQESDAPTPVSAGSAPDGWSQHTEADLGLSLYIPPGWKAVLVNDDKLDIRETDGFAWMEINIITSDTDDSWSITYTPGTVPNTILSELVEAAQDDGDFDEPYELPSSTGAAIWATQGVYDVLEEPVFIGAVDQSERLLLVLGHALESDDWGGVYLPLYESMIQTITSAN